MLANIVNNIVTRTLPKRIRKELICPRNAYRRGFTNSFHGHKLGNGNSVHYRNRNVALGTANPYNAPVSSTLRIGSTNPQSPHSPTFGSSKLLAFLLVNFLASVIGYLQIMDEDVVDDENGQLVPAQLSKLGSIFSQVENCTSSGPTYMLPDDLFIDWKKIKEMSPSNVIFKYSVKCLVALIEGVKLNVTLCPSVDVRPLLLQKGLLDVLDKGLQSSADPEVRIQCAHILSELSKNREIAQTIVNRPGILQNVIELLEREMVFNSNGQLIRFSNINSGFEAESFVRLLQTVTNILQVTVDKNTISSSITDDFRQVHTSGGSSALLHLLTPDLIRKMTSILNQMEISNRFLDESRAPFHDVTIKLNQVFFPGSMRDLIRRRVREIEGEIAHLLDHISKDEDACERLLLNRDVLRSLAPLAVAEHRNASAFVYAVDAVHNIIDRVLSTQEEDDTHQETSDYLTKSLLVDSHLNQQAISDTLEMVATRDEGHIGGPCARFESVYAMRCFISSLGCFVVGGVYGILRTNINPVLAYSVNGIGAALLNGLYGKYGVRNWIKDNVYIENEGKHFVWSWSQAFLDIGIITSLVRHHPYALLPVVFVNICCHSGQPGAGLNRLDGLDCLFTLNN